MVEEDSRRIEGGEGGGGDGGGGEGGGGDGGGSEGGREEDREEDKGKEEKREQMVEEDRRRRRWGASIELAVNGCMHAVCFFPLASSSM